MKNSHLFSLKVETKAKLLDKSEVYSPGLTIID